MQVAEADFTASSAVQNVPEPLNRPVLQKVGNRPSKIPRLVKKKDIARPVKQ